MPELLKILPFFHNAVHHSPTKHDDKTDQKIFNKNLVLTHGQIIPCVQSIFV